MPAGWSNQGTHAAAVALADWFASANHDDVFAIMDCNVGFDPRADLAGAGNRGIFLCGGIMIGIGNPTSTGQMGPIDLATTSISCFLASM